MFSLPSIESLNLDKTYPAKIKKTHRNLAHDFLLVKSYKQGTVTRDITR